MCLQHIIYIEFFLTYGADFIDRSGFIDGSHCFGSGGLFCRVRLEPKRKWGESGRVGLPGVGRVQVHTNDLYLKINSRERKGDSIVSRERVYTL
jgi:hypothetical protein